MSQGLSPISCKCIVSCDQGRYTPVVITVASGMCLHTDSWIGSDVSIPVTVRITEMSKADKEGRTYRGKALPLDNDAAHSAGKRFATWLLTSERYWMLVSMMCAQKQNCDCPVFGSFLAPQGRPMKCLCHSIL